MSPNPTPSDSAFVLRFLEPAIAPIAGRPGQLLVVSPGHPTHTLAVYDPAKRKVVRHRRVEVANLYEPLLVMETVGILAFATTEDRLLAEDEQCRVRSH
jgi:hypothetical protein